MAAIGEKRNLRYNNDSNVCGIRVDSRWIGVCATPIVGVAQATVPDHLVALISRSNPARYRIHMQTTGKED